MAYSLRQAYDRAFNRINGIEDITLEREYSIINSYKVINELDDDQKDAMLQLIENGLGYANLPDREVARLEKLVFETLPKSEPETSYTIVDWDDDKGPTEWATVTTEAELHEIAQCIQDNVSEDEPLMDMLINIISPENSRVVSFNAYCREHQIWRPSQRESQEEFKKFNERIKAMFA